jgi:hypothetical protein
LRHFIAYHNEKNMGYSCTDIPEPRVQTSRQVAGLEGVTVWLVAGEGSKPKSYFLTAKFVARVSRILCKRRLITAEAFFPQTE